MAQKIVYPSLYPLPGSSYPPLALSLNTTLPISSSFAPSVYSASSVYYAQDYYGHSTTYPGTFVPPMENPTLLTNNTTFREVQYPFHDMRVGNATSTAITLPSVDTGHHERPASFTSQYPPPTQPEAALDQQQFQYYWQVAQEDLAAGEPSRGLEEVPNKDDRMDEVSHMAFVAPEVHFCNDQLDNRVPPPEENTTVHGCSKNPNTTCSGRGVVCLDILFPFVVEYPEALSAEQVTECVIASRAPREPNVGQSAGRPSQVDATDAPPPPPHHRPMGWGTASLGLNTTVSAPTSSGTLLYAASHPAAETSLMGSTSRLAVKHQPSEDHLGDHPNEQRREGCTNGGGLEDLREPCNDQMVDCREKQRKKKSVEGKYICRLCIILGRPRGPLSRKDALKRHILSAHAMFAILFNYENFDILRPRRRNEHEDPEPLIALCITVQSQARQRGMKIGREQDLALLYPHVASSLNLS
ncbi:hypothetical protein J3R83DRAFT_9683 [Lanmaoa asiatica]|nr:hypothetical protein J3R83DRAFT_9683 [Lanmaoa asiatica]